MKRLLISFVIVLLSFNSFAQKPNRYLSVSGEINFSGAKIISETGEEGGNQMRFQPWFNLQFYNNVDKDGFGFFHGFTIRNIGFTYEKDNEKWKARTYNLGIPLGIKFGDMDGMFVYAGYEFEVPIHYRERYFRDENKTVVNSIWFSNRVSPYTHAAFIGFDFKYGFNLKFKYYFTEMFNKDFDNSGTNEYKDIRYSGGSTDPNAPAEARPYLTVNNFYVAVTWNMFRKPYYYTNSEKPKEAEEIY